MESDGQQYPSCPDEDDFWTGARWKMAKPREFRLKLIYEKRRDGRFYIHSSDLPGLHLAGSDLDRLQADLEPVIKELLFFNWDFVAEKIKWLPPLDLVKSRLGRSPSPPGDKPAEEIYVITGRAA